MRPLAPCWTPLLLALGGCTESGSVLGPGDDTPPASAISAGMTHACAIRSSALACWGGNQDGQLGTGDSAPRNRPSPVSAAGDWQQVCTGEAHTCALDATGAVWCWGGNQRGQLGSGTREPALQPELVTLPGPARSLSCDFNHGCALLSDGRLYCWGQNGEGELGQDDAFPGDAVEAADGLTPLPVAGSFRSVDTGQGHTCAIAAAGTLFCWGRNSFYELGSEPRGQVRSPLQVGTESDWERVDAGQNHSCGLRRDGSLWCWGRNTASDEDEGFPLGIEGPLIVATPTRVGDAANWSKLATSIFHTCAIDAGNALFCWGRNIEGQLGVGSLPVVRAPEAVADAVAAVATGGFFGCAIRLDGTVACAGENAQGQLGTGDNERRDRFSDLAPP